MRKFNPSGISAEAFFEIVDLARIERNHRALAAFRRFSGDGYRKFDYKLPLGFEPRMVFLLASGELRAELFCGRKGAWPTINKLLQSGVLITNGGTVPNLYPAEERDGFRIDVTVTSVQAHNPAAWFGLAHWLLGMLEDMIDTFEPIFDAHDGQNVE